MEPPADSEQKVYTAAPSSNNKRTTTDDSGHFVSEVQALIPVQTAQFVQRHWTVIRNLFGDRIPSGITGIMADIVNGDIHNSPDAISTGSECLTIFIDKLTVQNLFIADRLQKLLHVPVILRYEVVSNPLLHMGESHGAFAAAVAATPGSAQFPKDDGGSSSTNNTDTCGMKRPSAHEGSANNKKARQEEENNSVPSVKGANPESSSKPISRLYQSDLETRLGGDLGSLPTCFLSTTVCSEIAAPSVGLRYAHLFPYVF